MDNKTKQDNVPQVKSVEAHAEEVWDKHSEYIDDSLSSMDSIAGSSVIPSRYRFLKAAQDIAAPLVDSIAELEADLNHCCSVANGLREERDKLREALERLLKLNTEIDNFDMGAIDYAEDVLKGKEAKGG